MDSTIIIEKSVIIVVVFAFAPDGEETAGNPDEGPVL